MVASARTLIMNGACGCSVKVATPPRTIGKRPAHATSSIFTTGVSSCHPHGKHSLEGSIHTLINVGSNPVLGRRAQHLQQLSRKVSRYRTLVAGRCVSSS